MHRTSNGWSMVGMCSQWAVDEKLTVNELSIYMTILRNSFGYKHRWCYVSYKDFTLSNRNTIKKTLDGLIEKKIISSIGTFKENGHRSKNEYRILEPKKYISNFIFRDKSKDDKQREEMKEVELGW